MKDDHLTAPATALLQQIIRCVRRYHLFRRGEHVLLCVSGGADSMALLTALHELAPKIGIRLSVCHLNHRLRGHDADEDERFVRRAAARLGIKCVVARPDVSRLARERGQSLEMAGREARYDFFARASRSLGCDCVATAHTADDQAETILLRLARGTSARGLRGIPRATSWKGVRITRPLRDLDRKSIVRFLERRGIGWREDASNRDTSLQRNLVRHEVIPFLESKLNPRLRQALLRLGDISEDENEWLEELSSRILAECSASAPGEPRSREIICEKINFHPAAARRRVLRQWLLSAGVRHQALDFETMERLDRLLTSRRASESATLEGGWKVRRECGRIKADREDVEHIEPYSARVRVPGRTILPSQGLKITATMGKGFVGEKPAAIGSFPARAWLSAAAWRRRKIVVRSWKPGDRMSPHGMSGSKKVQDIFVDMKVPSRLRHRIPLFECGGEIIWLTGYRIARGWEVAGQSARSLHLCVDRLRSVDCRNLRRKPDR